MSFPNWYLQVYSPFTSSLPQRPTGLTAIKNVGSKVMHLTQISMLQLVLFVRIAHFVWRDLQDVSRSM
jgi:hypothetical protein